MKIHIKTHPLSQKNSNSLTYFALKKKKITCRSNHEKSANKIKLDLDPNSTEFIQNHHKTPIFRPYSYPDHTYNFKLVYTAQFAMLPIVDVLRACSWHKPREAKKFHDFQTKMYTYNAAPPQEEAVGHYKYRFRFEIVKRFCFSRSVPAKGSQEIYYGKDCELGGISL